MLELNNKQQLAALECKWKEDKIKAPAAFSKAYPEAEFNVINKDNYLDWITKS